MLGWLGIVLLSLWGLPLVIELIGWDCLFIILLGLTLVLEDSSEIVEFLLQIVRNEPKVLGVGVAFLGQETLDILHNLNLVFANSPPDHKAKLGNSFRNSFLEMVSLFTILYYQTVTF